MLADIKDAACKAILQVQLAGSAEGVYTQRRQGISEPFTTFTGHLTQAIERQCDDDLVLPHLLCNLAFANANEECKKIIHALADIQPDLPQMIEAGSKIGGPQHIATIQADTLGKRLEETFAAKTEVIDQ